MDSGASQEDAKRLLFFCPSLKEGEDQKEIKIEPAQAVDEVEPLPEDYYTRPVNLTEGNVIQDSVVLLYMYCCFYYLRLVS